MEQIAETSWSSPTGTASPVNSFADLGSDDFLKLLIMELRNQDPLEPLGNEELLRQISSIRDIELSTTLTSSLKALTGQQNFGSASALVGQYVTSLPDESGGLQRGIVVGVRFAQGGAPVLLLGNGGEMPLERVSTVEPPLRAAEALIGQAVVGLDRRVRSSPEVVEGVVTGARTDNSGEVMIELDTGRDLRFRDLVSVAASEAA